VGGPARGAQIAQYIRTLSPNLALLSKEDRKTVSFGFAHVEMIRQAVFVARQADRDPVIASAEGQLALGQGSLVASGQFCQGLKRTFGQGAHIRPNL
jgi:hypothetical protein